ncbi:alpha/beta hydrolase [Longispora fulva]|uniref:Enterochelin esterase-like enzyme n=1 Tax=Longispora fulva TaxID=619741 RepID=A0A8J7GJJ8_9ACTN|nr:alpha/beta hydrolase-fold protein [Longispora fulva]MBG6140559.1 enterochelin esterase-like enzyme [Longispora fulva]
MNGVTMANPLNWSLVRGPLPIVVTVLGLCCLALLLARRGRTWWTWVVPIAAVAAGGLAYGVKYASDNWVKPFPDALPDSLIAWGGATLLAAGLAGAAFPRLRWRGRVAVLLAVLPVLAMSALQINKVYAFYPTLRAALGMAVKTTEFRPGDRTLITAPAGKALSDVWRPPAGMPTQGTVSEVEIPGTVSGWKPRTARVYLPPAYQSTPRAQLPVLVLLAGQPGSTADWFTFGLKERLDRYANTHDGLAPVVVFPDDLGTVPQNPLCMDSKLGNVETYLKTDVPAWVRANLQVNPNARSWVIGGYSHGGTCALQLGVRAPEVYPSFIDISGQREPTVGNHRDTVDAVFDGDAAKFAEYNPLDILRTRRFPDSAAVIAVGLKDRVYLPEQREVAAACQKAGIAVKFIERPGGHDAIVWLDSLDQSLPWLAQRTGMTH